MAWVYVVDALSRLVLIASLFTMRDLPPSTPKGRAGLSFSAAWEGIRFVFTQPLIRSSMLLDFFATFFGSATALLPIFAQDVLKVRVEDTGTAELSAAEHIEFRGAAYSPRCAETRSRNKPSRRPIFRLARIPKRKTERTLMKG